MVWIHKFSLFNQLGRYAKHEVEGRKGVFVVTRVVCVEDQLMGQWGLLKKIFKLNIVPQMNENVSYK